MMCLCLIYLSVSNSSPSPQYDQYDADCFILNTCHIRDKAKEKVYHEVGRVKKIYENKKKPIMIVAGCVAQAENDEMFKREPYIDIVIGPQSYHKINNVISNYRINENLKKQKLIQSINLKISIKLKTVVTKFHLF